MKTHTNLSRAGIVLLGLMLLAGTARATDLTDRDWFSSGSFTQAIRSMSGTSLDHLYVTVHLDTNIYKYDATDNSWNALASWDSFYSGSTIPAVAAGSDGQLYALPYDSWSTEMYYFDGTAWSTLTVDNRRRVSLVMDGNNATAVGTNNTSTRVLNGGDSYSHTSLNTESGGNENFSYISYADGTHWTASYSTTKSSVNRSTDGGATWSLVESPGDMRNAQTQDLWAISSTEAVIAPGKASSGDIYRTNDSGQTWNTLTNPWFRPRGVYAESYDNIWVVGTSLDDESYGIAQYNEGTWSLINLPAEETFRFMTKVGDEYFVAGMGGTIYTTIPEPSTLMLLGSAAGLVLWRRRRVGRAKADA